MREPEGDKSPVRRSVSNLRSTSFKKLTSRIRNTENSGKDDQHELFSIYTFAADDVSDTATVRIRSNILQTALRPK